ncbi:hypothetical protein O7627_00865 [Solwaraspora sp. WMMD1047]|uniref:TolB family protein n=1 Tax=Solwaraspora sp. WMMD1047 TaxID=3016102 RepID=UPI0024166043|nr:hypothetical protein [Solwaraspora sp. WMMD1047]MDG4827850.1 hypothetical protein [Solwaraspora sp. WMMD1047]
MIDNPGMASSSRSTRRVATVLLVVLAGAGCSSGGEEDSRGPVRVNPVPAGVEGLGPAVFAVRVEDERRTDLVGLVSVHRFGDEIAEVPPARRHARIALGDPTTPTVAEGLAEDPRDALLVGGRLVDTTLPEDTYAERVFRLGPDRSWTESRCLIVRADATVTRPAVEARCHATRDGGLTWQVRSEPRYGGIDPTTGTATGPVSLPNHPIAVSADGRHLATVTRDRPRRLVIGDAERGTSTPTSIELPGGSATGAGVFTADGYATVHHRPGELRKLLVVRPDGTVRTLLTPVGEVAFAPDGRFALVVQTRPEPSRLAVVDLAAGTVRPVTGAAPIEGRVVMTVTGSRALVAEIRAVDLDPDATRPARVQAVDLSTGDLREITTVAAATTARATGRTASEWSGSLAPGPDPAGGAGPAGGADPVSERAAGEPAALRFAPGGETASIAADGTVTVAPPGLVPRLGLPGERMLHLLTAQDGDQTRHDRLSVLDTGGGSVEIDTGADADQRINGFVATADGQHLIVSLRAAAGGYPHPGPRDEIVLVRLDGAEPPLVLYRGAVLASLGADVG